MQTMKKTSLISAVAATAVAFADDEEAKKDLKALAGTWGAAGT